MSHIQTPKEHPEEATLSSEAKKRRFLRNMLIYLALECVVLMIVIWDDVARRFGV